MIFPTSTPIRLLVADDHPIVTQGMQRYFAASPEHIVVATAATLSGVLDALSEHTIDIVILDIQMPGLTGPESIGQVAKSQASIILYSLLAEDALVASLIKAGASGFVSKSASLDILSEAISVVHQGGSYLSETLIALISEDDPPHLSFSAREKEIFDLLAKGTTTKEVAFQLGIAASTVYTYTERIRQRLGVSSITEVIQYAEKWRKLDNS